MASLIIQDSFEPYYAGRDNVPEARETPRGAGRPYMRPEDIVLPAEAPLPPIPVRRDRRAIAH